MSGMSFLLIVVVISVVGSIFVWLRNRQPNDPLSSVGDFQREMEALGSTPPAVVEGGLEVKPVHRVNTVQIRPNISDLSDAGPVADLYADSDSSPDPTSDSGPDNDQGR